jgi:hypothetical protein
MHWDQGVFHNHGPDVAAASATLDDHRGRTQVSPVGGTENEWPAGRHRQRRAGKRPGELSRDERPELYCDPRRTMGVGETEGTR